MLFEVSKYKPAEQPAIAGHGIIDQSESLAETKLSKVIDLVDHGRSAHWVTEGDWSMHNLLEKILEKTGPADVWISSYAFSEKPARIISNLKATGVITNLFCLIDSRVDVRSASALTMMRNASDRLKLCNTHAKVTVIKNEQWFLVIAGSANYTTNKRYEAGFISTQANVALFHQTWITNELGKSI